MVVTKMTFTVILSLVFVISLSIIYFSKERMSNDENKIYQYLIIGNIIGLILHLLCDIVSFYYDSLPMLLSNIVLKLLLVYYLLFGILILSYLIAIINSKKKKTIMTILKIITILAISTIFVLPSNIVIDKQNLIFYTNGIDTKFVFIISAIEIFFLYLIIIINYKNLDKKKIIPLIIFSILAGLSTIIQLNHKDIVITDCMETIIILLMYFTIENPDLKMLQQLEVAKEEADKANRAKTDFLSSMSHEIRTPLNAIVGFSEMIKEANSLEDAKTNARDIVNASQTLLEIVNGILDISKIEAGKLEIKEAPYDAKSTFEDLAKLIKPRMEEKGLDFTYFIAPDIPKTLYGDHANIKKIVTNFLSNAAKYTNQGFVKYEVNCINTNGVCKLIISVEDSGRGIKQESVNQLFEKFDRLDVERNTTIEGTGLGLAITKQLVEMMGGRIIVHTVYKQGSKFTVMLDQKIEQNTVVETEEEVEVSDTLNLKGIKILLVDDNDLNIKVGSKLLEKLNADHIDTAKNGFECIDKVRETKYDLILLDDMMPKKSGTETLKELKAMSDFRTPTVALTANAIAGMRESYLATGFDEYLSKPIDKQELMKVINKLLRDKLSHDPVPSAPVAEESHVIDHQPPTNATEAPTEETNTVIETNPVPVTEQPKEEPVPVSETPSEAIPVPEVPSEETDEQFLRNRGVDMDKALELLGDMEMYNMTMEDFAAELENKWSKLEQEKLQNDMENYAIDVHSLKSDCKYLGFYDLADVAYEHELKSKENNSAFVNDNFERLENEYAKVLKIVNEYKSRH